MSVLNQQDGGARGRRRLRFECDLPFGDSLRLRRYRLGNGLRIYCLRDPAAPVVSYHTWFGVGSRDEAAGKTGLAHMFEHLMFFGTKRRPRGEFDALLEARGVENNASTWTDWTQYTENLPRAALPLVIELEADRLENLVIDEDGFRKERDVVRNERSQTVDDDLYGAASERLWSMAFDGHPYAWPTIGYAHDIAEYTRADCQAFHRRWYAPNNATLVLAGDFDEQRTLGLIRDAYAGIQSTRLERADPPTPTVHKARRATLRKPSPTTKLLRGYPVPGLRDPRSPAVPVLRELLTGGLSARLTRALTRDEELVTTVYASSAPFRDGSLLEIWCDVREGVDAAVVDAALDRELSRLCKEPPSAPELSRVKHQLELAFLTSMESVSGKAEQVGFYDAVLGDPTAPFARLEAYRAITAEDVQALARETFRASRCMRVRVVPSASKRSRRGERAGHAA